MKSLKVLVTGGAGYLGSVLTRQLLKENYEVCVMDNFMYGFNAISGLKANFKIMDVRNTDKDDIENFNTIVHLASIVGDNACDLDPKETVKINYESTRNLAELCNDLDKHLIFTSTCSVYGRNPDKISKEDDQIVNPLSLYGETKLKSERGIEKSGCKSTILRLGTLFGLSYRMRFDLAINLFIAQAYLGETLNIFGGQQIRPFCHVKDTVLFIMKVIKEQLEGKYNVAWKNIKIKDAAYNIAELLDGKCKINKDITDERNYKIDINKMIDTGFKPKRTIDYACGEISSAYNLGKLQYYKNRMYSNYKSLFENENLMKMVYTQGPIWK